MKVTAPLAHRDFRLLWGGFVASHVGDMVQVLAQNWLVVDLTRSARLVAAVSFAQALPRMLVGLLAGVVVDRVDRRRLLLATQLLALLQSALFLSLLRAGRITYAAVVALALVLGLLDALNLTARQAMLPSLVPREQLPAAVALQALGVNVTQLLGPSLGGVLLARFGVPGCLVFNIATFGALLVSLFALRTRDEPPPPSQGVLADLREGLSFVRGRDAVWVPVALAWALGFLAMPVVRLLPLYARVVLGTPEREYGLLAAASGVGALSASLLVTARSAPSQLPRNMTAAGIALGLATAVFAATGSIASAAGALVLFGASQMAFRSAVTTQLQLATPNALRGRVGAILALDFGLWSLGAVALGAVADRLSSSRAGALGVAPTDPSAVAYGLRGAFVAAGALVLVSVLALRPRLRAVDPPQSK